MPLRLGHIIITKSRKPFDCRYCKEAIGIGEFYPSLMSKTVISKKYFSVRFHEECLSLYILEKTQLWMDKRKSTKRRSAIEHMDPDQRRRRKSVQYYINRSKLELIAAYERHDPDRVFTVMRKIGNWQLELLAQDAPFKQSLFSRPRKNVRELIPTDRRLLELLDQYDKHWVCRWENEELSPLQRVALLTTRPLDEFDRDYLLTAMERQGKMPE